MFFLPLELQKKIFEYDKTYRNRYKLVLLELKCFLPKENNVGINRIRDLLKSLDKCDFNIQTIINDNSCFIPNNSVNVKKILWSNILRRNHLDG